MIGIFKIEAPTILIPSDAVVMFERVSCPDGWIDFHEGAGRTIIGVGHGPGLSDRKLKETGGEEAHTLTIAELPKHSHRPAPGNAAFLFSLSGPNGNIVSNPAGQGWFNSVGTTSEVGEGRAYNTMPPFIALRYCKKR